MNKLFSENYGINEYVNDFFLIPEPEHKEGWEREYEDMSVHTRGEKPEDTLLRQRPNEEPEAFQYRLDSWESITTPAIKEALDSLYRIFNQMQINVKGSPELLDWVKNTTIYDLSFQQFITKVVLKYDIDDPNGIALILPTGEGVFDDSKRIEPVIELYNSCKIKHKYADLLTVESYEFSEVDVNGNKEYTGIVYYVFTDKDFYKLIQFGIKSENKFRLEFEYNHNLGYLPYVTLGGDLKHIDYYESFFSGFKAFGNIAVSQFSDWRAVMLTSAYPIIEELSIECTNKDCRKGWVFDADLNREVECSTCGGKGYVIPMSPFDVRIRKQPDNLEMGTDAVNMLNIPSRRYISPPVDIVKYGFDAFKELLKMAKQSLHLVNVEEAQSGVAKEIDREDKYSMLLKISDNLYDNIILGIFEIVEGYLNPTNPQPVSIIKPMTFDLKSESDLVMELKELQASEAPVIFIAETVKELIKKRFQNSEISNKIFEVLSMLDPLMFYSTDKKNQMLMSGIISKEQYFTSVFGYAELIQYIKEQTEAGLIKQDTMKIVSELITRLKNKVPQMMPLIDNSKEPLMTDVETENETEIETENNDNE